MKKPLIVTSLLVACLLNNTPPLSASSEAAAYGQEAFLLSERIAAQAAVVSQQVATQATAVSEQIAAQAAVVSQEAFSTLEDPASRKTIAFVGGIIGLLLAGNTLSGKSTGVLNFGGRVVKSTLLTAVSFAAFDYAINESAALNALSKKLLPAQS